MAEIRPEHHHRRWDPAGVACIPLPGPPPRMRAAPPPEAASSDEMPAVSLEFTFEIDPTWTLDAVQLRGERVMELLLDAEERTVGLTDSSVGTSGRTVTVSASLAVTDSAALSALRLREIVCGAVSDITAFPLSAMTQPGLRDLDLNDD